MKNSHQVSNKNNKFSFQEQLKNFNIQTKQQKFQDIWKKLVLDSKLNARQKLKNYKKIMQSQTNNQQTSFQQQFIKNHLKSLILKEYLLGSTQSKPVLQNLVKKIHPTFQDLVKIAPSQTIESLQQIKYWSEISDIIWQNNKKQFSQFQKHEAYALQFIQKIKNLFLDGVLAIKSGQFKSKWLQTFNQIVRALNLMIRMFKPIILQQHNQISSMIQGCQECVKFSSQLSKQNVSQIYLLYLFFVPNLQTPTVLINQLHYYHAKSVITGQSNLQALLLLLPRLKQTQHKCQIVPFLQKSFQLFFQTYHDKDNCFDQVINLFEVGRSIYSYLQGIIKTIISHNSYWNMQGNFIRKFFVATIALKIVPTTKIIQLWPRVIEDVIIQSGNMNIPYAADCANILFQKFYSQVEQDQKKWSDIWLNVYLQKLQSSEKVTLRGIIEFINPILIRICNKPFLLRQILELYKKKSNQNLQLGVISLIQCYKLIGKINIKDQSKIFFHIDDPTISFQSQKIFQFLLSTDQMISLKALQLIALNHKTSQLIKPLQFNLLLQFYKHSTKTSLPQYRKNYLGVTKKLFDRLRTIYQNDLTDQKPKKSGKKMYFNEFRNFLVDLVNICFYNIFPDAIFELVSSSLEILQLILTYFGTKQIQIKKGVILEPTQILKQTQLFSLANFENIIICLQSSYQSVRKLANQILNYFCDFQDKELLNELWQTSIKNTNKLAIKNYQYACRVLNYISTTHSNILSLPKKYKNVELNILEYFLQLMKKRFLVFKQEFVDQGKNYYENLIHGVLTIFSYTLENLIVQLKQNSQIFKEQFNQMSQFFDDFFNQMIQILIFSVEVSSSNISTVVLDTVSQSQTQKKLKVDCRGHFLLPQNQKSTNIGTYLQSSALMSSMEDDVQQGIQNNLVVSFYLLTRQAGLVFQSIGNLISTQKSNAYIPKNSLIKLINTYFYALINLKHMGSVDRISNGLGKMAKVIFDHQDKQLSQTPQILLNKLLTHLKDGNFTNILRRSSGVPFAFCCLLKSDSAKHCLLIQKIVTQLLALSSQNEKIAIQQRIHSLNILKKLFQDSDLKNDLDPFVSDAFVSSIKGFTSQQWGIRNSSLMLFTVLSNRTVGVKSTYNLLQFFNKCPSLFEFIESQLLKIQENKIAQTMYPPLYPIALLFSRILPFDIKEKSKIPQQNNGSLKQIKKDKLLRLLPILDKSGLNNNYMGRVMTAKAILPFMQIDKIYEYCLIILTNLQLGQNYQNNYLHYQLTKCHHLLNSYNQITEQRHKQKQYTQKVVNLAFQFITKNIQKIQIVTCPSIQEGILKIISHFILNLKEELFKQFKDDFNKLVQKVLSVCSNLLHKYLYEPKQMVIKGDLGHSIMRKQAINLLFVSIKVKQKFYVYFQKETIKFVDYLIKEFKSDENYFIFADTEIIEYFLGQIIKILQQKEIENITEIKSLIDQMSKRISQLPLKKIKSDRILIKILKLRSTTLLKSAQQQQQIEYLQQLERITSNHFLKIAIFKYFVEVKIDKFKIMNLLLKYSDPQSLQELRQCCLMYLNTQKQLNLDLLIVYIRLLQDQEYEIRKQTSQIVSRLLNIYRFNQTYLKNIILSKISLKDFQLILKLNSDFQIKFKNHIEERIFSFDKPNKFRSDISTLAYILIKSKELKQIQKIVQTVSKEGQLKKECIQQFSNQILARNQYLFQSVIRSIVINRSNQKMIKTLQIVKEKHQIFKEIFDIYVKQ